uniref:Uncharacterized protein n=1 Tax=Chromera velia CCMP2878 TaxID=1169474 RepID=A0A0G4FXW8_9ALVE|eukprot:Cvel_19294.t1-p1 / transcript=Cvel_19294.t1 / gene=Cvel_19294 / organism=Chromera_velia_CCMP2878 / gene_product=hypothetical protein / transcript_product=hypothetical protein / location=Cvel_scaffold1652:11325-21069(-) / protein_length=1680 / sequence_SO=supercontig / SO=protein_coding / is_pseudo=false
MLSVTESLHRVQRQADDCRSSREKERAAGGSVVKQGRLPERERNVIRPFAPLRLQGAPHRLSGGREGQRDPGAAASNRKDSNGNGGAPSSSAVQKYFDCIWIGAGDVLVASSLMRELFDPDRHRFALIRHEEKEKEGHGGSAQQGGNRAMRPQSSGSRPASSTKRTTTNTTTLTSHANVHPQADGEGDGSRVMMQQQGVVMHPTSARLTADREKGSHSAALWLEPVQIKQYSEAICRLELQAEKAVGGLEFTKTAVLLGKALRFYEKGEWVSCGSLLKCALLSAEDDAIRRDCREVLLFLGGRMGGSEKEECMDGGEKEREESEESGWVQAEAGRPFLLSAIALLNLATLAARERSLGDLREDLHGVGGDTDREGRDGEKKGEDKEEAAQDKDNTQNEGAKPPMEPVSAVSTSASDPRGANFSSNSSPLSRFPHLSVHSSTGSRGRGGKAYSSIPDENTWKHLSDPWGVHTSDFQKLKAFMTPLRPHADTASSSVSSNNPARSMADQKNSVQKYRTYTVPERKPTKTNSSTRKQQGNLRGPSIQEATEEAREGGAQLLSVPPAAGGGEPVSARQGGVEEGAEENTTRRKAGHKKSTRVEEGKEGSDSGSDLDPLQFQDSLWQSEIGAVGSGKGKQGGAGGFHPRFRHLQMELPSFGPLFRGSRLGSLSVSAFSSLCGTTATTFSFAFVESFTSASSSSSQRPQNEEEEDAKEEEEEEKEKTENELQGEDIEEEKHKQTPPHPRPHETSRPQPSSLSQPASRSRLAVSQHEGWRRRSKPCKNVMRQTFCASPRERASACVCGGREAAGGSPGPCEGREGSANLNATNGGGARLRKKEKPPLWEESLRETVSNSFSISAKSKMSRGEKAKQRSAGRMRGRETKSLLFSAEALTGRGEKRSLFGEGRGGEEEKTDQDNQLPLTGDATRAVLKELLMISFFNCAAVLSMYGPPLAALDVLKEARKLSEALVGRQAPMVKKMKKMEIRQERYVGSLVVERERQLMRHKRNSEERTDISTLPPNWQIFRERAMRVSNLREESGETEHEYLSVRVQAYRGEQSLHSPPQKFRYDPLDAFGTDRDTLRQTETETDTFTGTQLAAKRSEPEFLLDPHKAHTPATALPPFSLSDPLDPQGLPLIFQRTPERKDRARQEEGDIDDLTPRPSEERGVIIGEEHNAGTTEAKVAVHWADPQPPPLEYTTFRGLRHHRIRFLKGPIHPVRTGRPTLTISPAADASPEMPSQPSPAGAALSRRKTEKAKEKETSAEQGSIPSAEKGREGSVAAEGRQEGKTEEPSSSSGLSDANQEKDKETASEESKKEENRADISEDKESGKEEEGGKEAITVREDDPPAEGGGKVTEEKLGAEEKGNEGPPQKESPLEETLFPSPSKGEDGGGAHSEEKGAGSKEAGSAGAVPFFETVAGGGGGNPNEEKEEAPNDQKEKLASGQASEPQVEKAADPPPSSQGGQLVETESAEKKTTAADDPKESVDAGGNGEGKTDTPHEEGKEQEEKTNEADEAKGSGTNEKSAEKENEPQTDEGNPIQTEDSSQEPPQPVADPPTGPEPSSVESKEHEEKTGTEPAQAEAEEAEEGTKEGSLEAPQASLPPLATEEEDKKGEDANDASLSEEESPEETVKKSFSNFFGADGAGQSGAQPSSPLSLAEPQGGESSKSAADASHPFASLLGM